MPQTWAQSCFFVCAYNLAAWTYSHVANPVVLWCSVKPGKTEGGMEYEENNAGLASVLNEVRLALMIGTYVGFTCVLFSPRGEWHHFMSFLFISPHIGRILWQWNTLGEGLRDV